MEVADFQLEVTEAVEVCQSTQQLEDIRIAWLGKKGRLTEALKELAGLPPDERKTRGASLNAFKENLLQQIEQRKTLLIKCEIEAVVKAEKVDVTLPTRPELQGRIHPVSKVIADVVSIFSSMGFQVSDGPEIDDDEHNFTALNFPLGHPAREMHDTFYLPDAPDGRRVLLRTHTSNMQVRVMKSGKPPFRVISPGKTYRSDSDMTHTPMFHQVEGFIVDKGINMAHLKGCLARFAQDFFGIADVPVRFRPSYFPFTEPSAEMDIGCSRDGGVVKIGMDKDWLEILGCGMIHPNVLTNCGIDPDEWQGFAFGMGVERLAMLKYGMPDLRSFFDSDQRWLNHYGFHPAEY